MGSWSWWGGRSWRGDGFEGFAYSPLVVGCLLRLERGEKKVLWKKENGGGIEALALEYPQRSFFA